MRAMVLPVCLALAAAARGPAMADQPADPGATGGERLVFSADGAHLSDGSGGGGGSATWLHNLDPDDVIGAGADYEQIANAHWTTGTLSGSFAVGTGSADTHLYAEVHGGAGDIAQRAFHYWLELAGAIGPLASDLSWQLEARRIDIDTSHGNLPKLGLALRATAHLLVSASYMLSAGGNLGTRLGTLRFDYAAAGGSLTAGVSGGRGSPVVINLFEGVIQTTPGLTLTEGFAGFGRTLGRTDWLLFGDYQDLAGTKRTTVTLTCTVHLRTQGRAQ
jgi:hypothetical protein